MEQCTCPHLRTTTGEGECCLWRAEWLLFSLLPLTRLFYNRNCFLFPACFLYQLSLCLPEFSGRLAHTQIRNVCSQWMPRAERRQCDGWSCWPSLFLQKCFSVRMLCKPWGSFVCIKVFDRQPFALKVMPNSSYPTVQGFCVVTAPLQCGISNLAEVQSQYLLENNA